MTPCRVHQPATSAGKVASANSSFFCTSSWQDGPSSSASATPEAMGCVASSPWQRTRVGMPRARSRPHLDLAWVDGSRLQSTAPRKVSYYGQSTPRSERSCSAPAMSSARRAAAPARALAASLSTARSTSVSGMVVCEAARMARAACARPRAGWFVCVCLVVRGPLAGGALLVPLSWFG